ncbi:uncharacterized protein LOC130810200 [Amaranthus tricolor]|uniref:uncharacterized protein LOC130810200 n=1 Tax=Amaranthus tricolor TaxID=29722 RepID=UPI002582B4B5|nr:uncharacterized protein LOC130810200 [Amaranthus tricolor]
MSTESHQSTQSANFACVLPNNDPSSVYYIHPSDYTPQLLVTSKFNGTGFHNWKKCILMAFSARNKLDFLHETLPKLDTTHSNYSSWIRYLEERFAYSSHTKIYNLEKQLADVDQGNLSVLDFYTKFKVLWDDLNSIDLLPTCTCNNCTYNMTGRFLKQQQNRKLIRFMMKLNEQFSGIRSNVLMMKDLPHLSEAYRLFAQEETHKEIAQNTTVNEPLGFAITQNKPYNTAPYKSQNYKSYSFPNTDRLNTNQKFTPSTKRPSSSYFCTHCKVPGHSYERCFKIHGYPVGFKGFKDKKFAASI